MGMTTSALPISSVVQTLRWFLIICWVYFCLLRCFFFLLFTFCSYSWKSSSEKLSFSLFLALGNRSGKVWWNLWHSIHICAEAIWCLKWRWLDSRAHLGASLWKEQSSHVHFWLHVGALGWQRSGNWSVSSARCSSSSLVSGVVAMIILPMKLPFGSSR